MKSFFQISLASLFVFSMLLVSCNKENYDIIEPPVDLPVAIDTIVIDDPIALTIRGNENTTLLEGKAYWGTNSNLGAELYVLASENVTVECPGGMSSSHSGTDGYFFIQFISASNSTYALKTAFRTEIDGEPRFLDNLVPPECGGGLIDVEFEVVNNRISGTLSGEFFYLNPVITDPFSDCSNFISVGILEVSFDLPLLQKCFEV